MSALLHALIGDPYELVHLHIHYIGGMFRMLYEHNVLWIA